MKLRKWADLEREALSTEQRERVRRRVESTLLELNLRAVRELAGKTQVEVAKESAMSQSEISKAERREDHLLSTLRRYVKALGGELEVIARFGKKSVRLKGV